MLKTLLSPSNFVLELRREIKLIDSDITEADMIPDIEKTWLRNEKCFMVYGKSFEFFRKWEGDLTDAEVLFNGVTDADKSDPLFDQNPTTYVTVNGDENNNYEIIFNEPILMHAVTIGTVQGVTKYANICFEIFGEKSEDENNSLKPEFVTCSGGKPEYEFITLMVPQTMTKLIRVFFRNKFIYRISSLAVYHRGEYNQAKFWNVFYFRVSEIAFSVAIFLYLY